MFGVFLIIGLVSMMAFLLKKTSVVLFAIAYCVIFKQEDIVKAESIASFAFLLVECLVVGFLISIVVSGFLIGLALIVALMSMTVTFSLDLLEKAIEIIKD